MAAELGGHNRRVKLYVLNEDHVWTDQGTGHVGYQYATDSKLMSLVVRSEIDGISDLLCQKVAHNLRDVSVAVARLSSEHNGLKFYRRSSVFCHVARPPASAPAHQALKLHVDLSLDRFSSADWKRYPGRPHGRWVDQLHEDNHSQADLRSTDSPTLVVRTTRLSTLGDRAFPVAAARAWNSLPPAVRDAPSLLSFRSHLKTRLFELTMV